MKFRPRGALKGLGITHNNTYLNALTMKMYGLMSKIARVSLLIIMLETLLLKTGLLNLLAAKPLEFILPCTVEEWP